MLCIDEPGGNAGDIGDGEGNDDGIEGEVENEWGEEGRAKEADVVREEERQSCW